MGEPRTIYCPSCGRKVCKWDGKATVDIIADCRKCRKRVVYRVATGETEMKAIPQRNCSSGVTFH